MKQKKALLTIVLAFIVLLGGAYALYDRLGESAAPQQLAVQNPPAGRQAEQEADAPQGTAQDVEISSEEEKESEKVLAPDFTVYDLDGNEVRLSDYIGKPVVLNFWASWCGPCKMEMPDFDEAYAELGDEIQFLMVNVTSGRETLESASAFIEEQGYSFPVFYDTDSDAAMTYGVYSLPTTLFIDAEGYGIAQAAGAIDAETLQNGIDMISE